jgi:hypothetical protein
MTILELSIMLLEWCHNLEHHSRGTIFNHNVFTVFNRVCHHVYSKGHFICDLSQGILKGEISLYHWPPVWLVWNKLYDYWHFCFFYLQNRLIQTSQIGGQQYSDTSPLSISLLESSIYDHNNVCSTGSCLADLFVKTKANILVTNELA